MWQWSTHQASSMYQMHGTSLLSTPLPLWTSIITLGKKIDDEKTLLLKIKKILPKSVPVALQINQKKIAKLKSALDF